MNPNKPDSDKLESIKTKAHDITLSRKQGKELTKSAKIKEELKHGLSTIKELARQLSEKLHALGETNLGLNPHKNKAAKKDAQKDEGPKAPRQGR